MANTDSDLRNLHTAQAEATALIVLLLTNVSGASISSSTSSNTKAPYPTHNPLAVLHTAGTLLRAQATHLGLLALTPPFTPSALTSTLRTIIKLLPALVAALQDAAHPRIPRCVAAEARIRVRSLLEGWRALVAAVPADAAAQAALTGEAATTGDGQGERCVLRGTGVVWADCAWCVNAGERGASALAATQLVEQAALLDDAAGELEAWVEADEETDEGYEEGAGSESEDEGDFFGPEAKHCPSAMQPLAQRVLEHVRELLRLRPLLEREVKAFPRLDRRLRPEEGPTEVVVQRLDGILELAAAASRNVDEWAVSLYGGEEDDVRSDLQKGRVELEGMAVEVLGKDSRWTKRWKALGKDLDV